ncbi:hypothetical protein EDC01DRAFT_645451 [Geopyxis carbonaria]|nr:hypothetical protein EDC01DRAFT_645451 [Geopyxis carbonaria]
MGLSRDSIITIVGFLAGLIIPNPVIVYIDYRRNRKRSSSIDDIEGQKNDCTATSYITRARTLRNFYTTSIVSTSLALIILPTFIWKALVSLVPARTSSTIDDVEQGQNLPVLTGDPAPARVHGNSYVPGLEEDGNPPIFGHTTAEIPFPKALKPGTF